MVSRNKVIFRHKDIIGKVLGVLVCDNKPEIYPRRCVTAATMYWCSGRQYQPSVEVFPWKAHQCTICQHFNSTSIGGQPKKKQNPGHPATISTRMLINHATFLAPPSFFTSDTPTSVCEPKSATVPSDLLCPLCLRLLDQPVQLTVCNN